MPRVLHSVTLTTMTNLPDLNTCDVCWGSHGCRLEIGHEGHHFCCCDCPDGVHIPIDAPGWDGCVGAFPYYGPETRFYQIDDGRV